VTGPTLPQEPLTLLTFAPMIDSETSRLVLSHYRVPYRESWHIFGWASVLTLLHGGYGRIPVLYGRGMHVSGPRAIVDRLDERCPDERRLLPAGQPLRTHVEADWARYNGDLAAHTAVFAYFSLLPHREIMIEPFSRGIPSLEAALVRPAYPLLRGLFTALLRLSPERAADALTRIRIAFDWTDARVADGRPYLLGDTLTLADFGLAAAAAPLLLPTNYRAPLPPLADMPSGLQAIVTELRQHPTARFVEGIYARHPPNPAPAG
jgi:glutathione S-transferase